MGSHWPFLSPDGLALVLREIQLMLALMLTALYAICCLGLVHRDLDLLTGLIYSVGVTWPVSMLVAVFAFIIIRSTLSSSRKQFTYRQRVKFDLAGFAFAIVVAVTAGKNVPDFCGLKEDLVLCGLTPLAIVLGSILSFVFLVSLRVGRYIHLRDKLGITGVPDPNSATKKTWNPFGPEAREPNPHSRFREPPAEPSRFSAASHTRPSEMEAGDSTWSV
ncbi:hypothetical protein MMC22_010546 [Lobaria immixta]|nr:hypothetical protein [Lobaria immixta]